MNALRSLMFAAALVAGSAFAGEPVDVNSANAAQLAAALDGVGMSKAEAIVAYRDANGRFAHPDELVNVKGIGIRTVDRNRDNIRLDGTTQEETRPGS